MSGHTKGPWTGQSPYIYASEDVLKVVAITSKCEGGIAEEEANARLIAAAPDLLAALVAIIAEEDKQLACSVETGSPPPGIPVGLLIQARAAIAKAEGDE